MLSAVKNILAPGGSEGQEGEGELDDWIMGNIMDDESRRKSVSQSNVPAGAHVRRTLSYRILENDEHRGWQRRPLPCIVTSQMVLSKAVLGPDTCVVPQGHHEAGGSSQPAP